MSQETEAPAIGPLDIRRVMAALPHRYPMLLVDKVERIVPDRSITAIKAVSMNEPFFQGHFPGRPIMPGVLIVEALAQAAGVLAVQSLGLAGSGKLVYFMAIEGAKFRVPVEPGCLLQLDVEFVQKRSSICKFAGRASVDGKLARVTLTYTKFGDLFDHSIDLVHPPFWWWAWIVGLPAAGWPVSWGALALTVIVIGYVLQRVEEGLFIKLFGMDMHVWRRFDSRFRLFTARRNPNLAILTVAVLFGRPDVGIAIVAIWVALCLLVHAVRIAQAAAARRAGPLTSWLA